MLHSIPTEFEFTFIKTLNIMKTQSKKNILLFACIATIVFSVDAQKLDASKVPDIVRASFTKHYPGITAIWEKEGGKYEAGFKKNRHIMSALFEPNGTMAEIETDIKITDLPAKVLAYVKEHYKGKTIKEGAVITKADGTINFEAEVAGKDIVFDANGNFLKVIKSF